MPPTTQSQSQLGDDLKQPPAEAHPRTDDQRRASAKDEPPLTDDGQSATATLDYEKTIRIAVTGDVRLTPAEVAVIDSPHFQRLRGVRQLGTVNLVYPTALHTRFDHSLGTLALADAMVLAIATNAKNEGTLGCITLAQRKLARMYGLLHDITHVPFGHTIEDELEIYTRHDKNPKRILHFLGPDSELRKVIERKETAAFYDRLMRIYLWDDDDSNNKETGRHTPSQCKELAHFLSMPDDADDAFIHDIVSNTVCADLLDYVARDNYFCNLKPSLEYRFLNYLYLKPKGVPPAAARRIDLKTDSKADPKKKRRVFVRLWKEEEGRPRTDILTDLADLLDARYKVAERAYFHHTKLVTGAMLGRAIQEYLTDEDNRDEENRDLPEDRPFPDDEYLYEVSDDTMIMRLCDWEGSGNRPADSKRTLRLATRLRERRLHRCIRTVYGDKKFQSAQEDAAHAALKDHAVELLRNRAERRRFENAYATVLGKPPGTVLIYAPPPEMNLKVARVNVHWDGRDKVLSDVRDGVIEGRLTNVLAAHQKLWGIRLIVDRCLNEKEIQLLQEAFELDFLVPEDREKERRYAYARRLIQHRLSTDARFSLKEFKAAVDQGAEILNVAARCPDWAQMMERAVRKVRNALEKPKEAQPPDAQ